jgi:hypothetical protein
MEPVIIFVAAIMIPITYLITSAFKKVKQREYLHKERLRAIEMGLTDLPAELKDREETVEPRPRAKRNGRSVGLHGVIWLGIGLGLVFSASVAVSQEWSGDLRDFALFLLLWAIPATFVGLGLIIYAGVTRRQRKHEGGETPPIESQ